MANIYNDLHGVARPKSTSLICCISACCIFNDDFNNYLCKIILIITKGSSKDINLMIALWIEIPLHQYTKVSKNVIDFL